MASKYKKLIPIKGINIMSMSKYVVVGDRMVDFTENENVITVSTAEKMIEDEHTPGNVRLHLGQGVSVGCVERMISMANRFKKTNILAFSHVNKAGRNLVHKHNPRNSMLGMPQHIGPNLYSADVFLDDECAEMTDHLTGQHVQGMVLVEACRQMLLAVTEEFYLRDDVKSSFFVLNQMNTEFKQFVFPVAISLLYEVAEHQVGKNGSHRFSVTISVIQNEQVCCVVTASFSTYFNDFILPKEKGLAVEAVKKELFPEMADAQVS
jgi:hypothetical protein